MANFDDMVLVGRIGRPHGLKGHVVVLPETDFVEERFAPGATVWTLTPAGQEQLTVAASRQHGPRVVVGFEGFARIEDVERLSGLELRVPEEWLQPLAPGSYYQHQLVGCQVETVAGATIGTVTRIEGGSGSTRLAVDGQGTEILIPLAADICRTIDIDARRVVVDPPEGLLDLNEGTRRGTERRTRRTERRGTTKEGEPPRVRPL